MKRTVSESSYPRIKEGSNILKIIEVEANDNFNSVNLTIADQNGVKETLKYGFEKSDGTVNDVILGIYTRFAGNVLGLSANDEFEDSDLLNRYFECEVAYVEGNPYISNRTGKKVTPKNIRFTNVIPAEGFDNEEEFEEQTESSGMPQLSFDNI